MEEVVNADGAEVENYSSKELAEGRNILEKAVAVNLVGVRVESGCNKVVRAQ